MSKIAPIAAMIFSIIVLAFLAGTVTAHYKVFPYPNIRDAVRTLGALIGAPDRVSEHVNLGRSIGATMISASAAPSERWTILEASAPRFPVIAFGGLNQYLKLCPDNGCLAVAFDADGKVTEAWPYRPVEIYATDITDGVYPHELLAFSPRNDVYPLGVQRYDDGSILVNFQHDTHHAAFPAFPFGMGVSRVGTDGMPRWTRFDFSHHWSTLFAGGTAYIPSLKVGQKSLTITLGLGPSGKRHVLACKTDRPQLDMIQIIDGAGGLVEEIELVPIFLRSNWAWLLAESTDFCDLLHLNYIDRIGADAGPGLAPGDLVLSLRNLSRFVIFDPKTRQIKRVVSGGFLQQHSVRHLYGSKFLIFDNRGGDELGPPSRIVELDLATGRERRIFPNADTPKAYFEVFSNSAGYLDISPDRSRVLASFTHAGHAFEVEIASGRLLAVYDNLHDISSVPDVPEDERQHAVRFSIYGMSYLR